MAIRTTYSAEQWEKVYKAFSAVSFVSYDFDTIKQSLLDYTKLYYPEHFNDYIESSEFIAILEMFAYVAEQIAYRVDMVGHENFITTAQRKQSILRLAKLISYKPTRNIPVRGLVKISSIFTTERVIDSRGVNLAGLTIVWNDPNNPNWKEQFMLVMNRVITNRVGALNTNRADVKISGSDVVMSLYSLNNSPSSMSNGVFPYIASVGADSYPMEVVPADIDANGPFEREPDITSPMTVIYSSDGVGDGSDYTGFLFFTKQGNLGRSDYTINSIVPNRRIQIAATNVNNTDVWVQQLDEAGAVSQRWIEVESVAEENIIFNSLTNTRRKYELDTRENDAITAVFSDGDFGDIPFGTFRFWYRQSANKNIVIQKNKVQNVPMSFSYISSIGNRETFSLTFGLTSTLQNGAATETIEHIRRAAPSTYYSQNRMVNGQDYNTYMLRDSSVLRLNAINRTFAGQPKYIDWHDASGQYENVKIFGDDLVMKYSMKTNSITTGVSGKALIDDVLEPLLKDPGVVNTLVHISATDPDTIGVVSSPRRKFIEDNQSGQYFKDAGEFSYVDVFPAAAAANGSLREKTGMQGIIDTHWYGEPLSRVLDSSGRLMGIIPDPTTDPTDDGNLYDPALPRSIDGVNKYPAGDTGSGFQRVSAQRYFGLRYNRLMRAIGNGSIDVSASADTSMVGWASTDSVRWLRGEVFTVEVQADKQTIAVRSNLRGTFPSGRIGEKYNIQPAGFSTPVELFTVLQGDSKHNFAPGDAFILDTCVDDTAVLGSLKVRNTSIFGANPVNLNGWWEILDTEVLTDEFSVSIPESQKFTTDNGEAKKHSWVLFVRRLDAGGFEIHYRQLKLTVSSPTTKFWYNTSAQLIDGETKKRVYDNIKILRSNIDNTSGQPLRTAQVYDVIGSVSGNDGEVNVNSLDVVPSDLLQETTSGDLTPDRLLQFEIFAKDSYEYFNLAQPAVILSAKPAGSTWAPGALVDNTLKYGRNMRMPALVSSDTGLDFMWQHFSPHTNIIDPSPTNIIDVYVMTQGYYDNVVSYVRGTSLSAPTPPTPLELRNSYGHLLDKKMISDTVVLHPGKFRLLFGSLAEPQLRAKFKIVRTPNSALSNERIKSEVLNVINTYFDIDGWDFGDTFYATELISHIHTRLQGEISSAVLVPMYSANSFGSLFTVEAGLDEILQSSAQLSDIEIVESLTPTVMRQIGSN